MALAQLDFEGRTRTETAIELLRFFEPPEGYYLAFSGGKDSQVVYHLAQEAGVQFDAHLSVIGLEPPELIRFVRDHYPDVVFDKPLRSFWEAMLARGYPNRYSRWCCAEFKERGGIGRLVVTGIRREESNRRAKRPVVEKGWSVKKWLVHPILDWTLLDVWGFIEGRGLPYCSLYEERARIGCVMCPLTSPGQAKLDAARWPKMAHLWRRGFERLYEHKKERGLVGAARFASWEEMYQWWLDQPSPRPNGEHPVLFE